MNRHMLDIFLINDDYNLLGDEEERKKAYDRVMKAEKRIKFAYDVLQANKDGNEENGAYMEALNDLTIALGINGLEDE